jgi:hypothetical protein
MGEHIAAPEVPVSDDRQQHAFERRYLAARRRLDGTAVDGVQAYSDSKLFVTALAFAFARRWPDRYVNVVEPGWVPTRMGGPGAPDDLELGHRTQTWLAVSNDAEAKTSGGYEHHRQRHGAAAAAHDETFQDALVAKLFAHTRRRGMTNRPDFQAGGGPCARRSSDIGCVRRLSLSAVLGQAAPEKESRRRSCRDRRVSAERVRRDHRDPPARFPEREWFREYCRE